MKEGTIDYMKRDVAAIKKNLEQGEGFEQVEIVYMPMVAGYRKGKLTVLCQPDRHEVFRLENE